MYSVAIPAPTLKCFPSFLLIPIPASSFVNVVSKETVGVNFLIVIPSPFWKPCSGEYVSAYDMPKYWARALTASGPRVVNKLESFAILSSISINFF